MAKVVTTALGANRTTPSSPDSAYRPPQHTLVAVHVRRVAVAESRTGSENDAPFQSTCWPEAPPTLQYVVDAQDTLHGPLSRVTAWMPPQAPDQVAPCPLSAATHTVVDGQSR